ncbi:MAG: LacI family DNA-binding transcriptional regulator [Verrucomicrobiota bacterium]|nr:LacI family DNA-binding transcriptional regulator [Verrucomicrobiota bacterium]
MTKPPTIKDVAALAGVSISTVSLVVHESGRVGEVTRARVNEAIVTLGYRPHPAFAALGRRSAESKFTREGMPIAWVFDEGSNNTHTAAAKDHIASALPRAEQLGYRLETFNLRKFSSPAALTKMLYARGFVGVVLEYFEDPSRILAMDLSRFSVTCSGSYVVPLPFHTASAHTFINGMTAYKSIWDRGYRRIGIAPQQHHITLEDDHARLGGALAAHMELAGASPEIPPNRSKLWDIENLYQWVLQYKPDAILCFNSGTIRQLKVKGMRIPEDFPCAAYVVPPDDRGSFAGIDLQTQLVAEQAIERLDQLIRLRQMGPAQHAISISIPGVWYDGPTLPVK